MVMFSLNPAALVFIQLMWQVFAETQTADQRNALVSTGESVVFNCNISEQNATQIMWTKDRFKFTFSLQLNQSFSNFSDRVTIEHINRTKLNIFNAQINDSGLYTCEITTDRGVNSVTWNLTVCEKEPNLHQIYVIVLPLAAALLLCCITAVICLCRKCGTTRGNQKPVQNQFQSQAEEVGNMQLQGGMQHHRNKRRREYVERLNSIYDHL